MNDTIEKNIWYEIKDYYSVYKDIKSQLIYGTVQKNVPLVTVAIPTYRRSNTLKEAIDSVLDQKDFTDYEIIVIDNDSEGDRDTDNLLSRYTKKYSNILYFRNEQNIGMAGNWNRGIELSRSKWVVLLHDDDLMKNTYLKTVYPILRKTKCSLAGIFSSPLYQLDENIEGEKKYTGKLTKAQRILSFVRRGRYMNIRKNDFFRFVNPSPVCPVLNRKWALKLGGYDCINQKPGIIDGKFHFSHTYHGKTIIIPQALAYKRVLDNDSLREEAVSSVITGVYRWGRLFQKEYSGLSYWWYGWILDVSIVYMAIGYRQKYNSKLNMKKLLRKLGVRKYLINMPESIIHIIKYSTLLDLMFRK